MRHVSSLLLLAVPLLVLSLAVPAGAEGFARKGALVAGGEVLFQSNTAETSTGSLDTTYLDLSPELTFFFADRFGVRVSPSFRYLEETYKTKARKGDLQLGEIEIGGGSETSTTTTFGFAAGPVYYLPLTGPLHLGIGLELGYDFIAYSSDSDASGLTYGGNVGLAYSIGDSGVVEAGLRYLKTDKTWKQEGVEDIEIDEGNLAFGLRVGVVL